MKRLIVLIFIVVFTTISNAQMGMMGSGMTGHPYGMGPGMMMQPGMMGMMWGYDPNAKQISIDQAAQAVRSYLNAYREELELVEIMEFEYNFYAEVEEENTGIHSMELLVNKYTGQVYPEMGPNMMWNTKYGMMGSRYSYFRPTAKMPVTPARAKKLASDFLNKNMPGVTADDVETFYGYYTLHTKKDGNIEGMLSVNGYNGAVWYHNWHGSFIQMKEFE